MTSSKIRPDIIIYGGPGSGKSTQADILVKKLSARHMNMGGLLRSAVSKKASGWQTTKKYMDKGGLVPESISSKLVRDFVAKTPLSHRIVFDGYPRRMLQIKLLQKTQNKFHRSAVMIFIALPASVAKKRLINRAKLEGRLDDADPKAIAARIKVFQERAKEVTHYYKQQGSLIIIKGDQTINQVARDIWQAVKKL